MKNKLKLLLDFVMLLAIATFYSKRTFGIGIHEIGGLVICAVFLLHIILNFKWLQKVPKRLLYGWCNLELFLPLL